MEKGEEKGVSSLAFDVMGFPPDSILRLPQLSFRYSASRENACLLIEGLSNHPLPLSRARERLRQFVVLRWVSKAYRRFIAGEMTEESSKGFGGSETRW